MVAVTGEAADGRYINESNFFESLLRMRNLSLKLLCGMRASRRSVVLSCLAVCLSNCVGDELNIALNSPGPGIYISQIFDGTIQIVADYHPLLSLFSQPVYVHLQSSGLRIKPVLVHVGSRYIVIQSLHVSSSQILYSLFRDDSLDVDLSLELILGTLMLFQHG